MTSDQNQLLFMYALAAPFMVGGLGLFMYWFTGSLDRREQRKQRAAE